MYLNRKDGGEEITEANKHEEMSWETKEKNHKTPWNDGSKEKRNE